MTTSPQRENETTEQYVTRLMEEAVALKGEDYVYQHVTDESGETRCKYIHDGQPSCIVGHVLVAAGVKPEGIREGGAAYAVVPGLTDWPEQVVDALDYAQKAQDGGMTWGEALHRYKRQMGLE